MEIKKCARCGQFFETINEECNGCIAKDNKDIGKLKNYFSYGYVAGQVTKGDISANTGVTMKNLNRLLLGSEFEDVYIPENVAEVQVSDKKGIEKA